MNQTDQISKIKRGSKKGISFCLLKRNAVEIYENTLCKILFPICIRFTTFIITYEVN